MIREIPAAAIASRNAAHKCISAIENFQLNHKKHPPAVLQLVDNMFSYSGNLAKVVLVYQHYNRSEYRQFEIPFNDEFKSDPDAMYSANIRLGLPGPPRLHVAACFSDLALSNQDYVIDVFDAWILDWLPLDAFIERCHAKVI